MERRGGEGRLGVVAGFAQARGRREDGRLARAWGIHMAALSWRGWGIRMGARGFALPCRLGEDGGFAQARGIRAYVPVPRGRGIRTGVGDSLGRAVSARLGDSRGRRASSPRAPPSAAPFGQGVGSLSGRRGEGSRALAARAVHGRSFRSGWGFLLDAGAGSLPGGGALENVSKDRI